MATKRQIAANRRNARHSTGPKTLQGKATASMNALRHGLRARTMVVPGEHQEDFDQIHAGLQGLYQPENPAEQYLVSTRPPSPSGNWCAPELSKPGAMPMNRPPKPRPPSWAA